MQYNELGRTGLSVSEVCLGTMTWGEQNTEREAHAQLDLAIDQGINFIDTAEMYPIPTREETQGLTEQYLGTWLKQRGRRDDLVIATKATGPSRNHEYLRGGPRLNAEHLTKAVEDSLVRLQTDYIDLYQLHWPERKANYFGKLGYRHESGSDVITIEETLAACEQLVRSGKVRHIGLSNETPWGLHEYLRLSDAGRGPRVASVQNPYNLLNRLYEVGLAEMSIREDAGLLAYSPLAFGMLSGKYAGGREPKGARLSLYKGFKRYTSEQARATTDRYVEVARKHNLTPVQLALGFVTAQPFVTANIIGATSTDQLQETIDGALTRIPDDALEAIEAVHLSQPNPCP